MPNGPILLFIQYRLSRVYTGGGGGQDYATYNRVILFNPPFESSGSYFVEGFGAAEFIFESRQSTHSFRRAGLSPQMLYNFDRFKVIGDETLPPQMRSRLSITPGPTGLQVNEEHDVFSAKFRDVDASYGDEIEAFNSTPLGTNTDIEFYDRDVRSVPRQRNIVAARARLTPTPAPEKIAEPLMETL